MNRPMLRTAVVVMFCALHLTTLCHGQAPVQPLGLPPYGLSINIETAKQIAAASIADVKKAGGSVAVAVVDPAGDLVYFEKLDDTQIGSIKVAIEKARTSALFRRPSKVFQDALNGGHGDLRPLKLPDVIPVVGGMPIIVGGKVVGAIGVSGAGDDIDERAARVGAAAVKSTR